MVHIWTTSNQKFHFKFKNRWKLNEKIYNQYFRKTEELVVDYETYHIAFLLVKPWFFLFGL